MWSIKLRYRKQWSSFEIIILGFAGVILAGALLLMLPVASREGNVTPFTETLFTATSAACVTGLAVRDTGSYWSVFGQSVILLLIQIGGLGVVTIAVSIAMLSGRKISLMQRSTMQDAISAPKVGGIVRLTRFILKGTFGIELLGRNLKAGDRNLCSVERLLLLGMNTEKHIQRKSHPACRMAFFIVFLIYLSR